MERGNEEGIRDRNRNTKDSIVEMLYRVFDL